MSTKTAQVYRNLTRDCWSIRQKRAGKWTVIGHAKIVEMSFCSPRLSEKQRQWCIARGERNVHAWINGHIIRVEGFESYKGRTLETFSDPYGCYATRATTYHPRARADFFYKDTGESYAESPYAHFDQNGVMYT